MTIAALGFLVFTVLLYLAKEKEAACVYAVITAIIGVVTIFN